MTSLPHGARQVVAGALSRLMLFLRNAEHRFQTLLHILIRSRPRRHADAHGGPSVPNSAAAPAGPLFLNLRDYPGRGSRLSEADQHLVENDIVEHLISRSLKALREASGMAAG